MNAAPASRTTRVIDTALIDEPELDVRLDRDPDKLEELSRDILRRGLIEPIKVFAKGERFEIIDGFRRFLAAKAAGLTTIECFVEDGKAFAHEGVKYAANAFREDMSAAEEAITFLKLLRGECGDDIEKLAVLVNKKISYIDNRLALVNGDELVFEAVKARKISLGVAAELNKIDDAGWCRYYLDHAIKGGASIAAVTGWVQQHNITHGDAIQPPPEPIIESGPIVPNGYDPRRCEVCGKVDPRFVPETISVHTHCKLAVLDPMLATYRGEQ